MYSSELGNVGTVRLAHLLSTGSFHDTISDVLLCFDDSLPLSCLAVKGTSSGWTLTPTAPKMTHTPTDDQSAIYHLSWRISEDAIFITKTDGPARSQLI